VSTKMLCHPVMRECPSRPDYLVRKPILTNEQPFFRPMAVLDPP
jgi:hypothetical protein